MEASPEVKTLIILGAVILLSAFALSWSAANKFTRLVNWIQATYPDRWNELPWALRRIGRGAAVEGLRHRGLGNDPEFARRYRDYKSLQYWMVALIVIGSIPLGVVIFGTQFWGWHW